MDTVDATSDEKRPLVALGYGPRCAPVIQLTDVSEKVSAPDRMDGFRNHTVTVVGFVHDCARLQAVNRLLHKEVMVSQANVSHDQ